MCNRADPRERTKTTSRHGDRRGQVTAFWDSFETINWLYLLFKCGIKTKTHFEWLLWHWSSLGQLDLDPTRPNGFVGCKVPTDLVKISVKDATHMFFYYRKLLTNYPFNAFNAVLYRYNAVYFHHNTHKRLPIARPWERCMGCLMWIWRLSAPSAPYCVWYHDKLYRINTTLDCIYPFSYTLIGLNNHQDLDLPSLFAARIIRLWYYNVTHTHILT